MNQPLHVAYTLKNQKAFRQLLDRVPGSGTSNANPSGGGAGGGTSSSGSRSWTNGSILGSSAGMPLIVDVNSKDASGRTVLHRVCSSLELTAVDYLRMLLNHPGINVNVQDLESRWTPLHRALYVGNIIAAVLLLQRPDVDIQLKVSRKLPLFKRS
jgi:ankyrin repeat protein